MRPEYLKKHAKIAFCAPSFGCTTSPYDTRLDVSIANLKKLGNEIVEGKNIRLNLGKAASNTPEERAKEIMEAFSSDSDAIFSAGGGECMVEILDYIDFEEIKKHPKWYLGYSDNTNLTYTITTFCDIETIYGVNGPSFYLMEYDVADTWDMLHGKREFKGYKKWELNKDKSIPLAPYNFDQKKVIQPVNYKEPVEGILLGGCLDILSILCGTKYDKTKEYTEKHKDDGIIFFMEACDLNTAGIRRTLFQLKSAGWFDHVSMFLIGRSANYLCDDFGLSMAECYKDMLEPLGKPILLDIDLGHLSPTLPMRTGAKAKVEFKNKNIYITYKD